MVLAVETLVILVIVVVTCGRSRSCMEGADLKGDILMCSDSDDLADGKLQSV